MDLDYRNYLSTPKNTLYRWDSRQDVTQKKIEKEYLKTYTLIKEIDYYNAYNGCFFNQKFLSNFLRQVNMYKLFINCKFELSSFFSYQDFFKNNKFVNCTFYASSYFRDKDIIKDIKPTLNYKNVIINKSYIEYVSEKYDNNLDNVPALMLKGISLSHSNLSKCTFPKNKYFIYDLGENIIQCSDLGDIDLSFYNMDETSILDSSFGKNSIIKNTVLEKKALMCNLPKIDFTSYNKLDYSLLNFNLCSFGEETIFPKDETFFSRARFTHCHMPKWDYSSYSIHNNAFFKCSFDEEAILPIELFKAENITYLENIKKIPVKELNKYVRFIEMDNPDVFIKNNFEILSNLNIYLLSKKYKLI